MEELEQNSNIYKGTFFCYCNFGHNFVCSKVLKIYKKKTLIHLSLFQVFLIMPDSFYKAFIT